MSDAVVGQRGGPRHARPGRIDAQARRTRVFDNNVAAFQDRWDTAMPVIEGVALLIEDGLL
jgi:hypothetical protein